MKKWKVALSLAVIAAIAVPALAGTWQLAPRRWVDLTVSQRGSMASNLLLTRDCTDFRDVDDTPLENEVLSSTSRKSVLEIICPGMLKTYTEGGSWHPPERVSWAYVVRNLRVAAIAFGLTFALAMVIPVIARRYWQWLRR
jgi:hypothetical protein